ncbi:MAG: hypothetical protein ACLSAP_01020 [Oscillospiraceae bacterium]
MDYALRLAKQKGFVPFVPGNKYHVGDKVFYNNRGKAVILAVIGRQPIEGVRIVAAHIDSPRLTSSPIRCMRTGSGSV